MKLYDLKPENKIVKPEVIDSWYLYLLTGLINYICETKYFWKFVDCFDVIWIETRLNLFLVHVHLYLLWNKWIDNLLRVYLDLVMDFLQIQ